MTLVIQTKAMEQVPALWNLQISLEIFRCLNSCQRRKNGCGQKTGRKKTIITWVSGGSKFTGGGGGGFMHIEFYYNFAKWWIKVSWLSHTQMSVTIIPQTRQKKKIHCYDSTKKLVPYIVNALSVSTIYGMQ